jgi:adenylosuccinate lyase
MLHAISPIDGRYAEKTSALNAYFSEFALMRFRVLVEVQYFIALSKLGLPEMPAISDQQLEALNHFFDHFCQEDAIRIKTIEKTTNHDVKAVEYFLKEKFVELELAKTAEFVHFGLTSQDINNTATPLLFRLALEEVYYPGILRLATQLKSLVHAWEDIPMLARTHGQPASPTRLGKELRVFLERLEIQVSMLKAIPHKAKFGGATGNFNAHYAAYPNQDWHAFADAFLESAFGLERSQTTTQIEHYDCLAAQLQGLGRINTILIDFCRDSWTYISLEYFNQQPVKEEVGSSAMPHKVNPIDFENAEGNLGIANALFHHLAEKLPVSRLQRDLTDSTVLRNLGVPLAHTVIALQAIEKGLSKISLNEQAILNDLENNWMVIAEGIQVILRRVGYPRPYEALKELTRGNRAISKADLHRFIDNLEVDQQVREELKALTPQNYVGR